MSFVKKLQNSAIDQAFQTVNATLEDHEERISDIELELNKIRKLLKKLGIPYISAYGDE